ncbi:uncharacterized protein LOC122371323 [Amphibalanus amphitrite]|uniref:uncharacterized protein LOC122371323 n=1 Tax=Amphibalanus amphitrite TaxID=1232801 RepID=UPI001C90BC93|nr:uncharacterized protein LOC122371323 [Amphibalanus amphitrite]
MDRDRWGHDQPEPAGAGSDDSDSEYEEITTTTRTVKKTTYNPKPLVEALRSKEMGANKKLFGKDLSEYDNMDMDDMLDQLTAEEIELLTRDVDPDGRHHGGLPDLLRFRVDGVARP